MMSHHPAAMPAISSALKNRSPKATAGGWMGIALAARIKADGGDALTSR
jgi:hypothetical protein